MGMRRKERVWKAWKVVDGQEKLLLGLQMDLGEVFRGHAGTNLSIVRAHPQPGCNSSWPLEADRFCQEACLPWVALGCPASWLPLFSRSKTPVSTHVRISAGKRFHIQTLETSPRGVEGGAREPLRALRAATYHRRAYMPPICLHRAIIIRLSRNCPCPT